MAWSLWSTHGILCPSPLAHALPFVAAKNLSCKGSKIKTKEVVICRHAGGIQLLFVSGHIIVWTFDSESILTISIKPMILANYSYLIGFLFILVLENVRLFLKKMGTAGTI
jgi:hypothetical protein